MLEKPLAIIIPSYNNMRNYQRNLDSIFLQKYDNYRVLYFDDCSTDSTWQVVQAYLDSNPIAKEKTQLFRSQINSKQSAQKFIASRLCHDKEIMLFIDGDDWLKHYNVFKIINHVYSQYNCWTTHGSFEIYHGKNKVSKPIFCQPVPKDVIKKNIYRHSQFCTSHLRTCYAWLYKQVPIEYLTDENGKFLPFSTDVAEMRALIELTGPKNMFISEVLYVYNKINSDLYQSSSSKRKDSPESLQVRKHIRDNMIPLTTLKKSIQFGINLEEQITFADKVITLKISDILETNILNENILETNILNENILETNILNENILETNILEDNKFYYLKMDNKVVDEEIFEMPLRYMINFGIDIFVFKKPDTINSKLYNLMTPNSYYATKNIVSFSLDNIPNTTSSLSILLRDGCLLNKTGYQRLVKKFHHQKILKFGEKMILSYL